MTDLAGASRSNADSRRLDAAHHQHPFSYPRELMQTGSRVIVRGDGCTLWDAEGNELLDGMAGLWCVNVGYGRRELAYRQMLELPYYNTFFKTTTPPAALLSAKLAELTPDGFSRAYAPIQALRPTTPS